jgi:hypothetical protein
MKNGLNLHQELPVLGQKLTAVTRKLDACATTISIFDTASKCGKIILSNNFAIYRIQFALLRPVIQLRIKQT